MYENLDCSLVHGLNYRVQKSERQDSVFSDKRKRDKIQVFSRIKVCLIFLQELKQNCKYLVKRGQEKLQNKKGLLQVYKCKITEGLLFITETVQVEFINFLISVLPFFFLISEFNLSLLKFPLVILGFPVYFLYESFIIFTATTPITRVKINTIQTVRVLAGNKWHIQMCLI